jgi:signal transduction histidine kinase
MDLHELPYIRLLLIEDDEDDYVLIERLLKQVHLAQYEVTWVRTCEDGLKEIKEGTYDVCLLDYNLGSGSGLEVLSEVAECPGTPPIIVLTGLGHYTVDVQAMEYGAADFLVKDQISELVLERAIRYAMERKKSKDALQDSERQLKHLATALLNVQENERRTLAAELHDDLGQLLAAIKFRIEGALESGASSESFASNLESLIPSIQDAIERVRNMYTQLMPTVLDDLGIVATLKWFCREFQNNHPDIAVESKFEVSEELVPADLKLIIFRIVQEAFKNVAEHSGSRHVRVKLIGGNGLLRLDIEDDGRGFDVFNTVTPAGTNWGLGLMSMKRRAELSGGSFEIESVVGSGTFVSAQWPHVEQ